SRRRHTILQGDWSSDVCSSDLGGSWTTSRGTNLGVKEEHSDAGGGHAHVGCMIYLGDNFPDRYRNGVFMCNLHGNRVNHDILERSEERRVGKECRSKR